MDIKLNVTLLGCTGNINIKQLAEQLRETLFAMGDDEWKSCGSSAPINFKVQVTDIEQKGDNND